MRWERKRSSNANNVKITIISLSVIILVCIIILGFKINRNNNVYAYENSIELAENVDETEKTEESEEQNEAEETQQEEEKIVKDIITEEKELEYTTIYKEDEQLAKGTIQIIQEGRNGKQEIVKERIYKNGELVEENIVADRIVKASIDKIVVTGTAKYKSNYKPKQGDELYVVADTLSLREGKSTESEKIYTLNKDDKVILQEINTDWYKVTYRDYTGFVQANGLTYVNPKPVVTETTAEGLPKEQLITSLSFDMALNKPSGLSLDQFQKILSGNERDVDGVFEANAKYFYYIEKQYNINGILVAAIGIHESAWGTSAIARNKNNLFGYGARDSNPYGGAYSFANCSEGIDLIARVLMKYYLNPAGTKIYDNQIATGDFYYGNTLSAINTRYATDTNWANKVYTYMSYLYNRL